MLCSYFDRTGDIQLPTTYTYLPPNISSRHISSLTTNRYHDEVIEWRHFPRYWPFVREIHRSHFFSYWWFLYVFSDPTQFSKLTAEILQNITAVEFQHTGDLSSVDCIIVSGWLIRGMFFMPGCSQSTVWWILHAEVWMKHTAVVH